MENETKIESFHENVSKLQTRIEEYFKAAESGGNNKKFTIPGIISRGGDDIEDFIKITELFNNILEEKNTICKEVRERADFTGGKTANEMELMVGVLKKKVAIQEQAIKNLDRKIENLGGGE